MTYHQSPTYKYRLTSIAMSLLLSGLLIGSALWAAQRTAAPVPRRQWLANDRPIKREWRPVTNLLIGKTITSQYQALDTAYFTDGYPNIGGIIQPGGYVVYDLGNATSLHNITLLAGAAPAVKLTVDGANLSDMSGSIALVSASVRPGKNILSTKATPCRYLRLCATGKIIVLELSAR